MNGSTLASVSLAGLGTFAGVTLSTTTSLGLGTPTRRRRWGHLHRERDHRTGPPTQPAAASPTSNRRAEIPRLVPAPSLLSRRHKMAAFIFRRTDRSIASVRRDDSLPAHCIAAGGGSLSTGNFRLVCYSGQDQIHYEDQHLRGNGGSSDPDSAASVSTPSTQRQQYSPSPRASPNDTTIWVTTASSMSAPWTSPSPRSQARATRLGHMRHRADRAEPRRDARQQPAHQRHRATDRQDYRQPDRPPAASQSAPSATPLSGNSSGSSPNRKGRTQCQQLTRLRFFSDDERPPSSTSGKAMGPAEAFSHQLNREALLAADPGRHGRHRRRARDTEHRRGKRSQQGRRNPGGAWAVE